MPSTPASPGPGPTPVLADARPFMLGIEMQCLVFARDQYLKSDSKATRTKYTSHAHKPLMGRVGEQEGGKEDEEDAKCRRVGEGPKFGFRGTGAEALHGDT